LETLNPLTLSHLSSEPKAVNAGLEAEVLIEQTLRRSRLVELLKKARTSCLRGRELVIPEQISFKVENVLGENLVSPWLLAQLQNHFVDKEPEIVRVQVPKISCAKVSQIQWGSFLLEGRNTFRFVIMVDGKSLGGSGEFKLFQSVPVAGRHLSPNEKIEPRDLTWQKRDVTFAQGYSQQIQDLQGRALNYPVSQGEPILLRHLKPENFIEKGQIIQVQYLGDNFVVSSSALAEQSGGMGDFVKIKNVESQKILSGVVTGKGIVEVQ
jgi:flagella basal body P-ring formation protein FlgA